MGAAAIDLDELLERLGGDREAVAELIDLFLEDTPPRLAEVRNPASDRAGLRRVAHTLKGASGNMGGYDASRAASGLEQAAGAGDTAAMDAARAALLCEMDRLLVELARSRAAMRAGSRR